MMARLLRRRALAVTIALATMAILFGCKGMHPGSASGDAGADASEAGLDASLPETVIIHLEAGLNPDGQRVVTTSNAEPVAYALPRPCVDGALGTVTFARTADDKVSIRASKSGVNATCVRLEEHKLLCDWFDGSGNPTATRKGVTFGPKTKIGGSYDAKHAFSCPAQDDTPKPPPAPKPLGGGRRAPKR